MRIWYDDIIYSLQKAGGISVVWQKITDQNIYPASHITYNGHEKNPFSKKIDKHHYQVRSNKWMLVKRYMNPDLGGEKKQFIFHSSYYRYCKNPYAINITTVHDFIYELYRNDLKGLIHKLQKKSAVMHSDGVICVSENTKRDLKKFYPEYKGLIKVIKCGYDQESYYYLPQEKREKNIIFIGSRASYKRFDLAVEIVSMLSDCKLLIIGGGNLTTDECKMLEEKIPCRYEKLGYVSNDALRELYNKAFFLIYCSDYEGFGIPVIEAQACGCPVVCQNKSSISEIVGDAGVFIDPYRLEESYQNIRRLYSDGFYKMIVENGLKNVKQFSWEKCKDEVLMFYDEVIKHKVMERSV